MVFPLPNVVPDTGTVEPRLPAGGEALDELEPLLPEVEPLLVLDVEPLSELEVEPLLLLVLPTLAPPLCPPLPCAPPPFGEGTGVRGRKTPRFQVL